LEALLQWLKQNDYLKEFDEALDVELEIPHIAYVEVKKPDSKVCLFHNPVNKAKGIKYDMPVIMNLFANFEVTKHILTRHPDEVAGEIEKLLHMKPPHGFMGKLSMLGDLFHLKNVFPKRVSGKGECQSVILQGDDVDLDRLPILKTWEDDGGPFITMGQVYTQSLDGSMQNLGMYRLQQYDKDTLGMHWQIHKDSSHFYDQYKDAGKPMPVSVAIGGDPTYIWCGQAPMPHGMFELLLYGLMKNKNAQIVKSITNDIYVPKDVDIVIEGEVDVNELRIEGPFGDHTGYYTLKEPYPFMKVKAITMKKKPMYQATVVGKPPLEDKYMGWATERIFLPLLKTTAPELIDYNMPENGVFHNFIMAKMKPHYKGHAKQFMHAFWGVGQMSFVKHAIFVDEKAPDLGDYEAISDYILNRVSPHRVLISEGVVDALDHSSPQALEGGKLGVDCTGAEVAFEDFELISDEKLLNTLKIIDENVVDVRQYKVATANPIAVISVNKTRNMQEFFEDIKGLKKHLKIVVVVDSEENNLDSPYMLLWRVVNNIDAKRDVILAPFIGLDGTNKNALDGYDRQWPGDVKCTKSVLEDLKARGLIDIDEAFEKRYLL
jgi:4-hydroxy-3-polyprenylbenzoate decarboxylase